MATRMLQRRGTAAEWAAENPILADGEMGFERDTFIIKMGDGVTPWNSLGLPYVPTGGGTMTGLLSLSGAPSAPAHAVRKTDLESAIATATTFLPVILSGSGNFLKGNYAWAKKGRLRMVGGGGGGGGAPATGASTCSAGSGGSSGGYVEHLFDMAALAASEPYVVGVGGLGTAGSDGTAGSASSFLGLVAQGGQYGRPTAAASGVHPINPTGDGGGFAGSPNILGCHGVQGGHGMVMPDVDRFAAGSGGPSFFGGGGGGASSLGVGSWGAAGDTPGSGGGGAGNRKNQVTNQFGGDGADGIIILELYG